MEKQPPSRNERDLAVFVGSKLALTLGQAALFAGVVASPLFAFSWLAPVSMRMP